LDSFGSLEEGLEDIAFELEADVLENRSDILFASGLLEVISSNA
jgi:hypothetical protein